MRAKFLTAILPMLLLILGGCGKHPRAGDKVLFWNERWDIIILNDSMVMAIPRSGDSIPIIMNTTVCTQKCRCDRDCDKKESRDEK